MIIPHCCVGDICSSGVATTEALAGVVEHFGAVTAGRQQSIKGPDKGLRIVRILESAQQSLLDSSARAPNNYQKNL